MSDKTTDEQIKFLFAALAAPFNPEEVRSRHQGGRTLHYVTASTVANRLDDVLGPQCWEFEVKPWGEDALLGTLSIKLPDGSVVRKMNVGGCADMQEGDNDAKSAASDCLKRCAALVGVARYLYGCGVAPFVEQTLGISIADHMPRDNGGGYQQRGGGNYQPSVATPRGSGEGRAAVNREFSNGNGGGGGRPTPDTSRPPRNGRGMWAWCKDNQEKTGHDWVKEVNDVGKRLGLPAKMVDWDEQMVAHAFGILTGSANGGGQQRQAQPAQAPSRHYDPNQPTDGDEPPF